MILTTLLSFFDNVSGDAIQDTIDLLKFYTGRVRPLLEYAAPAWSSSLPQYLKDQIESVQKSAFKIISPNMEYTDALSQAGSVTLNERRQNICRQFFRKKENPQDKIHSILPENKIKSYNLRKNTRYSQPIARTNRYKNSFNPTRFE